MLRTITKEELETAIEDHRHWLDEDCVGWEGMRAVLSYTDLRNADLHGAILRVANLIETNLHGADLRGAYLRGAYLQGADLHGANLQGADLRFADLRGASLIGTDLQGADLSHAHLRDADLHGADLQDANLQGTDLRDTDLQGADLRGAKLGGAVLTNADLTDIKLPEGEEYRMGVVLSAPIKGYKKTREGAILTAEIPVGATVFCINGSKCRTNRARIIGMGGYYTLHSIYNQDFAYHEGQEIEISDFDPHYNIECAPGFHFFRTRKEAEDYRE